MVDGEAVKQKLITIATPEIRDIADPFIQNHLEYARAHGYEYEIVEKRLWEHLHPSFSKVPAIDRALKDGWEWILFADADVAWTNMKIDIKEILSSKLAERPDLFLTGKQQTNWASWKYICNGLLVFRNTSDAHAFVEKWIDYCLNGTPNVEPNKRVHIVDHPYEQWSFDQLIRDTQYHGIYAATAAEIGAFCPEIWHDGEKWKPGMPSMHFAGPSTWEKRSEIFKRIYEDQVVR